MWPMVLKMRSWRKSALQIAAATACLMGCGVVAAAPAMGQTFDDVGSRHWARSAIDWVTDRGTPDARLLDDYGPLFKPGKAISRAQLARALAIVSGHRGEIRARGRDPGHDSREEPLLCGRPGGAALRLPGADQQRRRTRVLSGSGGGRRHRRSSGRPLAGAGVPGHRLDDAHRSQVPPLGASARLEAVAALVFRYDDCGAGSCSCATTTLPEATVES